MAAVVAVEHDAVRFDADRQARVAPVLPLVAAGRAERLVLADAGVPTAVHYPVPLHRQPAYEGLSRSAGRLNNSDAVADRVFSLPMHPYLELPVQERIARAVINAVA